MIYTTDDLCLSNLKYFEYWDRVKERHPNLKLIAFTIANYRGKENLAESDEFREWFDAHKNWVEIGVHGLDHNYPPEPERDDFEDCVQKSLEILKTFLPDQYGYRPPGFQSTIRLIPVLKKLGFSYVAYQTRIRYLDSSRIVQPIFNTHCCERFNNPITGVWNRI